jgi:hypothetical protein
VRDERWRPASEVPECTELEDADVIVEFPYGGKPITERANYADEKRGMKTPGFFNEYGHRIEGEITRWRYWPEPPTPEEERRRDLEERVLAMAARYALDVCPRSIAALWPEGSTDILREWAAKGGGA